MVKLKSRNINRILIIAFALLCYYTKSHSQQEITTSDVYYAQVDSIYPTNDTVKVVDVSSFQEGDKVLIIQMTGADYNYPDPGDRPDNNEIVQDYYNTGVYEIIAIRSVDQVNKLIVFIDALQRNFDSGEAVQMAKVVEHNYGVINNKITVKPWDGKTGGVFPILTYSSLVLNASIDASGAGFRGADPTSDPNYTGGCQTNSTAYFHVDSAQKGGLKGEGFITKNSVWERGYGLAGNGGGGTNGMFGGGGGGANYGTGGEGGKQAGGCSELKSSGGITELSSFYNETYNKITFGGGGGASTRDEDHVATKGGNGGGLILILTQTLESNNASLNVQGENVTGTATAGGGGGGAGGTVLIDFTTIKGSLNINVSGGDGGEVARDDICVGAGGGGGGGVFWYGGDVFPAAVSIDKSGGQPGIIEPACQNFLGFPGGEGQVIGNLRLPLTGFLFNFIEGSDTICAGQVPDTIKASMPRGGDGVFDYIWQYSLDSVNWSNYSADPEDSINFTTNPLDTTTYFRRVVTSAGQYDTSKFVKIFVWPGIENNEIAEDQVLCYQEKGETVFGEQPKGGDNNFFFRWEKSNNLTDWQGIDSSTVNQSIEPGVLKDTTYYRRYVQSVKVCRDFSDTVTIIVQPDLQNYDIRDDQEECYGYHPEELTGMGQVSGGDHVNYYYYWEYRAETGSWNSLNNDTLIADYQPPPLTDTTQYRRIVRSGVCIDTSNTVTIDIQPPIENNLIFEDHKICYGETAPLLYDNGTLTGGNHEDYVNNWQDSIDQASWTEPENNSSDDFAPGSLFDTHYYRRILNSGACFDTSNIVEIEVVPEIINQLNTTDTTLCTGFAANRFNETIASGGYGNFIYEWQQKPADSNDWEPASNQNDNPDYQTNVLNQSMLYRRAVTSDICTDYSDTVTVTILPSIGNNNIIDAPLVYTCYNIPKKLEATLPSGGNEGQYAYIWEKSPVANDWQETEGNSTMSLKDFVTPPLTDSMYYRRLVFSGEFNQCKDTSENILIRIHDLPTGQIISDYDTAICDGEEIKLQLALSGEPPWNVYLNENFNGLLESPNGEMVIQYSGTDVRQQHNIILDSIVDANNCRATDMTGEVKVTSVEVPAPEILSAEDVCEGPIEIEAADPKFFAYWNSKYANFQDSTNHITTISANRFDTAFAVKWIEINDICAVTAIDSMIFFRQPKETGIPADTIIYNTFILELFTDEVAFGNVRWQVLEEQAYISDSSQTFTEISFPENEFYKEYHVVYEIENGKCLQSDTMLVEVEDIKVPNAFSPNGDGINDLFYIEGIEDGRTYELAVFNSWGSIVYGPVPYDMTRTETLWDGRGKNGEELPDGTYYWILNINNSTAKKGFVILRRSAAGQ